MGFDPASVEVEKPEAAVRVRSASRADKPRHEPARTQADAEGGDERQGKKRKRRRGKGKAKADQQPQQPNLPRQAGKPAAPLALPPERDPRSSSTTSSTTSATRHYVPPQPQPPGPQSTPQWLPGRSSGRPGRTRTRPRARRVRVARAHVKAGRSRGQRQGGQGPGQNRQPVAARANAGAAGAVKNPAMSARAGSTGQPRSQAAADHPQGERLPTLEQLESLPGSRPRSRSRHC